MDVIITRDMLLGSVELQTRDRLVPNGLVMENRSVRRDEHGRVLEVSEWTDGVRVEWL